MSFPRLKARVIVFPHVKLMSNSSLDLQQLVYCLEYGGLTHSTISLIVSGLLNVELSSQIAYLERKEHFEVESTLADFNLYDG